MELGERIRQARLRAHLSQEKVAELIGVSRQAVTKWESGLSAPSTDNLFKLAEVLGTTVDILIAPEDKTASIAEQVYRLFREDEIRREAEKKEENRKNIRTCLWVFTAFLAIYLAGKLLCWKPSERALLPWLLDPSSTQHSYLFGWLLKSDLFQWSMLLSSLIALGGWRRLSLTTLAGFALALPIGELTGSLDSIVAPGYHYGWAIWGGIYLAYWSLGLWLQRMPEADRSLSSRQLRLWILAAFLVLILIPVLVLSGVPGHAHA